jgi:tetratricopeptide (TPR) repeat protein
VRRLPDWSKIKDLDANSAGQLAGMAGLLIELGDIDTAEKILTELTARDPETVFALAQFLGAHRDIDRAFAKLNEVASPANTAKVVATAQEIVRNKRDKVGEKYDEQIQRWLDSGLRENPDSVSLLMAQADFLEMQKKYQEEAAVHRKTLLNPDLTGFRRAVVLNNLAFLLALDPSSVKEGDDILKMINEAKDILGPSSDILDTRAVVYTAQKDYKSAIQDLELVVTDKPDTSKYYHKARAHLLDGQNSAALDAWKKAEELGLKRDDLKRMEFEQYEEMKKQIDQLRQRSVTQSEPKKKAA